MGEKKYAVVSIFSSGYDDETVKCVEATLFDTFDEASDYLHGFWEHEMDEEREDGGFIIYERSFCTDAFATLQSDGVDLVLYLTSVVEPRNFTEELHFV